MTTRPSLIHTPGKPDALLVAPEDCDQVQRFLEQKAIPFVMTSHPGGLCRFELVSLNRMEINRLISSLMALPR